MMANLQNLTDDFFIFQYPRLIKKISKQINLWSFSISNGLIFVIPYFMKNKRIEFFNTIFFSTKIIFYLLTKCDSNISKRKLIHIFNVS